MDYELIKIPWTAGSLYSDMSKDEAMAFFEWIEVNAEYRVSQLQSYINQSRACFHLDHSPRSLLSLGEWLANTLKLQCRSPKDMKDLVNSVPEWIKDSMRDRNVELTPESMSLALDVGIYFSRALMKSDDKIKWKMHVNASELDADHNQLVLTGPTGMQYNPVRAMQQICLKIAKREVKTTRLFELFESWRGNLLRGGSR